MLSGAAAETIFHRLQSTAVECGLEGPHMLSVEQMKSAGVSGYKARAITEFSEALKREPNRFRNWAALDYEALCLDVSSLWGLSKWSASILALSHFGMVDVWPAEDGSIKRAVSKVREGLDPSFDPAAGSPVRSYLAKAFWAALDNKII
jgi:DNA-3-methyladenine glycosylase II